MLQGPNRSLPEESPVSQSLGSRSTAKHPLKKTFSCDSFRRTSSLWVWTSSEWRLRKNCNVARAFFAKVWSFDYVAGLIPVQAATSCMFTWGAMRVLDCAFAKPDYDSTGKSTLLHREEIKYVHSHKIQQIFHNVIRRGLKSLCACWIVHSPRQSVIWAENEHSFHFCTGKGQSMHTARKFKKYSTTWFAGGWNVCARVRLAKLWFDQKMNTHSTSSPRRGKICTQSQNSANIP
jgi:hypothetical protein